MDAADGFLCIALGSFKWWSITLQGGRISTICLFHSWKVSRGKKRSRGSKADEDGFEVVPIEDPGKKYGERNPCKLQQ